MKKTVRPEFALFLILVILITSFSGGCNPFKRSAKSGSGLLTDITVCENVDPETYQPLDKTAVFPVDFDTVYCVVKLNNAPSNTEVKAQWFDNTDKLLLEKAVKTQGTRYVAFSLRRATDNPFTAGNYEVKFFANGKLQTTVSFELGSADIYSVKNKGADNPVIDGSVGGRQSKPTPVTEAPVVTMQQVAPNNFDLPAEEMEKTASPGEETVIAKDGMELVIPAGAVSGDTRVVVKEFTEPTPLTTPDEAAGLPEAVGVSKVYDFGPDGTKFSAPVQITIPYDDSILPPDVDENNISLAYFDGKNWVAIGGQVDTDKHTVSIRTAGFPGMPIVPLIIVAKVVGYTGALAYVLNLADEKKVPEKLKGYLMAQDLWGNAYKYVTPGDPIVKEYTKKAMIGGAANQIPLQDPQNPNQLNPKALEFIQTQVSQGVKPEFGFNEDGKIKGNDYYDPPGRLYHMWLTPADYFFNGMKGNCIDTANAYCSIFRALGLPAKCVDGYLQAGGRHAWVEVLIGNRIYYIDNLDRFMTLEDAEKTWIIRPYGKLKENYEWDEKGQVKYVPYWWTKEPTYKEPWNEPVLAAHVDNPVIKPETLTLLTVTVTPARVTTITVDGRNVGSTSVEGFLSVDYTIPDDAKAGPRKIVVRAPDLKLLKEIDVTVPGIQVTVTSKQVQPTGKVTAAVTVYPKGETPLEVTVFDQVYTGTTKADGSANISIPVPEQAEPGLKTLTVWAPTFYVFAEGSFTLVAAIKLDADTLYNTYKQGDALIINVRLSPPRVTAIELDGIADSRCQTDEDGFAFIDRVVSEDASPGQHTVTVVAPQLGLSKDVNFTVVAASLSLPTIDSFTASPTTITAGAPYKLSWSVSGATKVRLDGEGVPATSSYTGTLNSTHTFELMATNAAGQSVNRNLKVTVVAPQATTGSLNIGSHPPGADIYLNGQKQSHLTNTKYTNVEAADYTVVLKKAGYKDYYEKVTVKAGQPTEVYPTLVAIASTPDTPTQDPIQGIGTTRQQVQYCSGSSTSIQYKWTEIKLADGSWAWHGLRTRYYCPPYGNRIESTTPYVNGKENGTKESYNTEGKHTYSAEYVNGEKVKIITYNTNDGKIIEICNLIGGAWKCTYPK